MQIFPLIIRIDWLIVYGVEDFLKGDYNAVDLALLIADAAVYELTIYYIQFLQFDVDLLLGLFFTL